MRAYDKTKQTTLAKSLLQRNIPIRKPSEALHCFEIFKTLKEGVSLVEKNNQAYIISQGYTTCIDKGSTIINLNGNITDNVWILM